VTKDVSVVIVVELLKKEKLQS